jgi:hypothetical protein
LKRTHCGTDELGHTTFVEREQIERSAVAIELCECALVLSQKRGRCCLLGARRCEGAWQLGNLKDESVINLPACHPTTVPETQD